MKEYLTEAGREMLTNMLAGKVEIRYTKIAMGSGTLPTGQTKESMTELINKVKEIDINEVEVTSDNVIRIVGIFNNAGMTSGFYFREKGIYATDGTNEVLFTYANNGSKAEYIEPDSVEIVEKKIISLYKEFQDTEKELKIETKSGIYVAYDDMERAVTELNNKVNKVKNDSMYSYKEISVEEELWGNQGSYSRITEHNFSDYGIDYKKVVEVRLSDDNDYSVFSKEQLSFVKNDDSFYVKPLYYRGNMTATFKLLIYYRDDVYNTTLTSDSEVNDVHGNNLERINQRVATVEEGVNDLNTNLVKLMNTQQKPNKDILAKTIEFDNIWYYVNESLGNYNFPDNVTWGFMKFISYGSLIIVILLTHSTKPYYINLYNDSSWQGWV